MALVTLGLAVFVSLGYWQLGRAHEKQALFDAFMQGSQDTVDATGLGFDELARYQHVRLRGAYDATRQILLDNMPSVTGRPGFRVLTPFERADGRGWVLVDRGWVPLGATREDLPDVTVGVREREVSGILDVLPIPGASTSNRASCCSTPVRPTVSSENGAPRSASARSGTSGTRSSGSRSHWWPW